MIPATWKVEWNVHGSRPTLGKNARLYLKNKLKQKEKGAWLKW
jgi:hypothetical protein